MIEISSLQKNRARSRRVVRCQKPLGKEQRSCHRERVRSGDKKPRLLHHNHPVFDPAVKLCFELIQ